VIAPLTAMTTRERWLAHLPARDAEERAMYGEYRLAARPAAKSARVRTVRRDRT